VSVMEFMKWWTRGLADFLFTHCTPKQKRDNVKFIHGMLVLLIAVAFIFSPSRSLFRYSMLGCYVFFATMYATFGDCWVSQVEREIFSTKSDPPGVLDPVITILGMPKNKDNREITTRASYFFTIIILLFLTVRDIIGVY